MAAQRRNFARINLVPQDEFERSALGKILKWALTAGRSIVIMTEFVVILAFLSRFWLDRQLNDLNEVIVQKQAVVVSLSQVERQMRTIQERLRLVSEAEKMTIQTEDSLNKLMAITPLDVKYDSVDLAGSGLSIKGVAGSEASFSRLLTGLLLDERWGVISLGDTEFNQRKGGIVFDVTARAKKEGGGTR